MQRQAFLGRLVAPEEWDFIVIGGGATGLATAVDASSRGYRTLLLEGSDFAKGTSSRSTKLVHGGVRYLQQGNVSLVLEALKERGLLRQNAPHLVHDLPFVVPSYDWWEGPFYGIGLRLYDVLAGRHGFGDSRNLSKAETLERLPTIETDGLRGGVLYYDGQFDDARLAIDLAQTAIGLGATLLNYVGVESLVKEEGLTKGVFARDVETGQEYEARGRVVVNATGAFIDGVRRMDDPEAKPMIRPSQGVHITLDRSFLPSDTAVMVPHTDDGRVLFAIPWHHRVVLGTTDTPIDDVVLEPRAQDHEIEFLLTHAARYLTKDPTPADVLSIFAGIRPLVGDPDDEDSSQISRDHTLHISPSCLVTISGGKWTTVRKMAEDTVEQAATIAGLPERPCVTRELRIHGYHQNAERFGDLAPYGSDAPAVRDLLRSDARWAERLDERLALRRGEVVWAVRHEHARTVEDVLARRHRCLLLDARASLAVAGEVAEIMAKELGRDRDWVEDQTERYIELASGYFLES